MPKSKTKSREDRWASLTYKSGQRSGKVFQDIPGWEENIKEKAKEIRRSLTTIKG